VHAGAEGFVVSVLDSAKRVSNRTQLALSENPEFLAQREVLAAELKIFQRRLSMARTDEPAKVQAIKSRLLALNAKIDQLEKKIERLKIRAPIDGVWVAPQLDQLIGAFVQPGDFIGHVAGTQNVIVRALADQTVGPRIDEKNYPQVEMRVKGMPEIFIKGSIVKVFPAGSGRLPTPSMGYAAEGSLAVDPSDPDGTKTTENFFEIQIEPDVFRTDHGPQRAGGQARTKVMVTNTGTARITGLATIRLWASRDSAVDASDLLIGWLEEPAAIDIGSGQSKLFVIDVTFPDLAGQEQYQLITTISPYQPVMDSNGNDRLAQAEPEAGGSWPQVTGTVGEVNAFAALLPGQRVVVRFETGKRPLAHQWWLTIRQLVQRRFKI
jgi:hypothetical protein